MRVVIAMDSFKGSLSSLEAGQAVKTGVLRAFPQAETEICPLADGGEGTAAALTAGLCGETVRVTVTGPLGAPISCAYGIVGDLAVIEMAVAAGLTLVPPEKRDPMHTTTYGVGEVIRDAVSRGCRRFILGIGGSATNDGGAGMLQALGFDLLDADGRPVPYGAAGLAKLRHISAENALPALEACTFRVACDVENPLCGENGCSAVYGPQKGADAESICVMDGWLREYASLAKTVFPESDAACPGSGAAGGMGFALRTFLGASLESGVRIVMEETGLAEKIRAADVVVTGEGRMDAQTAMGKAPVGVAQLAARCKKPVLAFAGGIGEGARACNAAGILAFFPAVRGVTTLEEAMQPDTAARNLADSAEQAFRLLQIRLT
ncbi:MAG: glycerate kinase [Hominenteromicrobium sp.]